MTSIEALFDVRSAKLGQLSKIVHLLMDSIVVEETFAQIIDGKPTGPVYIRNYRRAEDMDGSEQAAPSPQAIEEYRKLRAEFRIKDILLMSTQARLSSTLCPNLHSKADGC